VKCSVKRILDDILGIISRLREFPGHSQRRPQIAANQLVERDPIALPGALN
jgi:hypothetical protein